MAGINEIYNWVQWASGKFSENNLRKYNQKPFWKV